MRTTYTIISAAYGVERYLPHFLQSVVKQRVYQEGRLQVIVVDDGSADGSADVLQSWKKRHPDLEVIRQANAGQGAARNAGLAAARGEWVTFIDPDDFVDAGYFAAVDRFIGAHPDCGLVAGRLLFHYDKARDRIADRLFKGTNQHALDFRFDRGNQIVKDPSSRDYIHLHAASAFFRRRDLESAGIRFDPRIRPCFEDGNFVVRYLQGCSHPPIGFCADAIYHYRKRGASDSTVDRAWSDPRHFTVEWEHGRVPLLEEFPGIHHVARAVLYDVFWFIKKCLREPAALDHLGAEALSRFKESLHTCLKKSPASLLAGFDLCNLRSTHRLAALALGGHQPPPDLLGAEILAFDTRRHRFLARRLSTPSATERGWVVGDRPTSAVEKSIKFCFLAREPVIHDIREWVPFAGETDTVSLLGNDDALPTTVIGGQDSFPIERIVDVQNSVAKLPMWRRLRWLARANITKWTARVRLDWAPALKAKALSLRILAADGLLLARSVVARWTDRCFRPSTPQQGLWIFIDRHAQADDNAEHLYRYVAEAHPEKNIRFVLSRRSADWERLRQLGFNLINYGSLRMFSACLKASHIISSQADNYIVRMVRLAKERNPSANFVFLQHGIIKDDLSRWLNPRPIDIFVTSTKAEYESIAAEGSPYRFDERQVKLTGLPRHDNLLRVAASTGKKDLILILPTWRRYLAGKVFGQTDLRTYNPGFRCSPFFDHWQRLLLSPRLRETAKRLGCKIKFVLHFNLAPYGGEFMLPEGAELFQWGRDGSIQDLLARAALAVTDYSSINFDAALAGADIIYYQFDREEFFSGNHAYEKGYFDYERDGLGPVCNTQAEVDAALQKAANRGDAFMLTYAARKESFFAYRDARNCKRVFLHIHGAERTAPGVSQHLSELPPVPATAGAELEQVVAASDFRQIDESMW